MKKTIGLFVIVMLASAIGAFVGVRGLPEPMANIFGSSGEEKAASELEREPFNIDDLYRDLGIPVRKFPLPSNWQEIIRTQASKFIKVPEGAEFLFGGVSPNPLPLCYTNPQPIVVWGWHEYLLLSTRTLAGTPGYLSQVYRYVIADDNLILFAEEFAKEGSDFDERQSVECRKLIQAAVAARRGK